MNKRKLPPPPDFGGDEWFHEYAIEYYFDPEKGDIVSIKLAGKAISSHDRATQRRLEDFQFAKCYGYEHKNGLIGGEIIRAFSSKGIIKNWGLLGDEDNWVCAVLVNGEWRHLKKDESWHFDFLFAGGATARLVGVDFYVNKKLVDTIMKDM